MLVWTVPITLLLLACARQEPRIPVELPEYFPAPSFTATTAEGRPFSSEELRGSIYVVSFFFTSCTGPCPIMNSRLSVLHSIFAEEPSVRFVSVTVDPQRDTPQVLKYYAERYGAKPGRWDFLWMRPDSTEWLATKGFRVPASVGNPDLHSTRLILVDHHGMVRGFFSGVDGSGHKQLEAAIRQLLAQMKEQGT
ncbi:MAG: SCO family protein [Candidatus Kapabacteria bacterium]|nr:SCO family protein [Candidatus Kapabacteria bacterium]MDW8012367.1 SCO family protein [Bacteroidota bacterium]